MSNSVDFIPLNLTSSIRTDSIPVRYVFPKRSLDINASADALFDAASASISAKGKEKETHVLVVWDVGYDWMAGEDQFYHSNRNER